MLAELRAQETRRLPRAPRERFERFAREPFYADMADARTQSEVEGGIRLEDPYADEGILDLVARLPVHALFHEGLHRGLFRAALRGKVPESIRRRTTKSWFEPAFAAAIDPHGGLRAYGDLWNVRRLSALEIVDARRFRAAIDPFLSRPTLVGDEAELWGCGVRAIACERFCEERG
jgi:hypothetical protein